MDIRTFILQWNARWPFDRHIRKKHGIAFGSPEHRALNFIDMIIEYTEDRILEIEHEKSVALDELAFEQQMGLDFSRKDKNQEAQKPVKMTQKEVMDEFENLDLSQFND